MNEATMTLDRMKRANELVRLTFRRYGPKSYRRGQGALLCALLEQDGVTQRELVGSLGISRRELKDVVKKAERNGLVAMEDDPAPRTYRVRLTEDGRAVAAKRLAANDRTAEEIVSSLSAEELEQLNAIAEKLIASAKERGIGDRDQGRHSHHRAHRRRRRCR